MREDRGLSYRIIGTKAVGSQRSERGLETLTKTPKPRLSNLQFSLTLSKIIKCTLPSSYRYNPSIPS